ncbi:MAG: hypothetical protein LE178_02525 [Endomicrobium sp.]|nr:hypothetical protein [Endomicrobium sp.]
MTCCYRVLLPKLLPDVDKILYTDVDVIFNDDLQELDKIDVSKYYVAVAKYGSSQKNLKSKIWEQCGLFDIYDKRQYVNAGILILNLKKIRQDGIDKK